MPLGFIPWRTPRSDGKQPLTAASTVVLRGKAGHQWRPFTSDECCVYEDVALVRENMTGYVARGLKTSLWTSDPAAFMEEFRSDLIVGTMSWWLGFLKAWNAPPPEGLDDCFVVNEASQRVAAGGSLRTWGSMPTPPPVRTAEAVAAWCQVCVALGYGISVTQMRNLGFSPEAIHEGVGTFIRRLIPMAGTRKMMTMWAKGDDEMVAWLLGPDAQGRNPEDHELESASVPSTSQGSPSSGLQEAVHPGSDRAPAVDAQDLSAGRVALEAVVAVRSDDGGSGSTVGATEEAQPGGPEGAADPASGVGGVNQPRLRASPEMALNVLMACLHQRPERYPMGSPRPGWNWKEAIQTYDRTGSGDAFGWRTDDVPGDTTQVKTTYVNRQRWGALQSWVLVRSKEPLLWSGSIHCTPNFNENLLRFWTHTTRGLSHKYPLELVEHYFDPEVVSSFKTGIWSGKKTEPRMGEAIEPSTEGVTTAMAHRLVPVYLVAQVRSRLMTIEQAVEAWEKGEDVPNRASFVNDPDTLMTWFQIAGRVKNPQDFLRPMTEVVSDQHQIEDTFHRYVKVLAPDSAKTGSQALEMTTQYREAGGVKDDYALTLWWLTKAASEGPKPGLNTVVDLASQRGPYGAVAAFWRNMAPGHWPPLHQDRALEDLCLRPGTDVIPMAIEWLGLSSNVIPRKSPPLHWNSVARERWKVLTHLRGVRSTGPISTNVAARWRIVHMMVTDGMSLEEALNAWNKDDSSSEEVPEEPQDDGKYRGRAVYAWMRLSTAIYGHPDLDNLPFLNDSWSITDGMTAFLAETTLKRSIHGGDRHYDLLTEEDVERITPSVVTNWKEEMGTHGYSQVAREVLTAWSPKKDHETIRFDVPGRIANARKAPASREMVMHILLAAIHWRGHGNLPVLKAGWKWSDRVQDFDRTGQPQTLGWSVHENATMAEDGGSAVANFAIRYEQTTKWPAGAHVNIRIMTSVVGGTGSVYTNFNQDVFDVGLMRLWLDITSTLRHDYGEAEVALKEWFSPEVIAAYIRGKNGQEATPPAEESLWTDQNARLLEETAQNLVLSCHLGWVPLVEAAKRWRVLAQARSYMPMNDHGRDVLRKSSYQIAETWANLVNALIAEYPKDHDAATTLVAAGHRALLEPEQARVFKKHLSQGLFGDDVRAIHKARWFEQKAKEELRQSAKSASFTKALSFVHTYGMSPLQWKQHFVKKDEQGRVVPDIDHIDQKNKPVISLIEAAREARLDSLSVGTPMTVEDPVPATRTELTRAEIILTTVKSDAKEIALRTGVRRLRSAARDRIAFWWASKQTPRQDGETEDAHRARIETARDRIHGFFGTEAGEATLAMLLGGAWVAASGSVPNETVRAFGDTVARELRVSAGSDILDGVIDEVVGPLLASVREGSQQMALLTPIRVLAAPGQAQEDPEERDAEKVPARGQSGA